VTAPDATIYYLLLQIGEHVYGTLCVTFETAPTPEKERLLKTCASQAAMALNRIDLNERARKSDQFEEADRLKTAILRAVSHDLRTPLTIIKSSANNLHTLGERLSPVEQEELVETIEQETDQLNRLVGNLLEMSRLHAGAMTLNRELNSLEEVAGDVAAQSFLRTKEQRIHLALPDDLPLLSFDYGLIAQALTNLVDNALRYEPSDRQIELRATVTESEVRLMVINHGETIRADERAWIMEPFYHGRNGQTGLGLAIAKGIVEVHHGRLWLEDTPGGGATFIIALPLKEETADVA
jgi:two-component system sensor histidine kinase KdpD